MTHFPVVVCIDGSNEILARARAVEKDGFNVTPGAVEECVSQALEPYDENREVAPYEDYVTGDPSAFWAVGHLREENGLNPDDATLTWAQVAEAYNGRYGDEEATMYATGDGLRAYTFSTRNPDSKWDWWVIGGRWGGYFPYHAASASQIIKGERGDRSEPLHCDGGPKSALDLDGLREEKAGKARKTYAEFHAIVAGTPEAKPWSHFVAEKNAGRISIDDARNLYHDQPRVRVIDRSDFRWYDDAIADFGQPEDRYVAIQVAKAVPGYAVLKTDGKWMAPGEMGWFGMSTDDESERIGYWEVANAYIESLPDTAYLVTVDCHI